MNKKLVFISMLIVLLALCFFSCDLPQISITVTGIDSTYNGKYGYVGLTTRGTPVKAVAVSLPVPISSGQFTGDLLAEGAVPFTDTGTYHCTLIITSDSAGQVPVWTGAKLNLKITDPGTTVKFSQFTKVQ